MDDVGLNGQIITDELRWVGVISQYPAHPCGSKKDIIRLLLGKESISGSLVGEIQLSVGAGNKAAEALAQISHESRANKAAVSCDVDFGVLVHLLRCLLMPAVKPIGREEPAGTCISCRMASIWPAMVWLWLDILCPRIERLR